MPITVRDIPKPEDVLAGTAPSLPEKLPEVEDPKAEVLNFYSKSGRYSDFDDRMFKFFDESKEIRRKLDDPSTSPEEKETILDTVLDTEQTFHACATVLAYELRDLYQFWKKEKDYIMKPVASKTLHTAFDNVLRWIMDNFPAHLVILWARCVLSVFSVEIDSEKLKFWPEFTERYEHLILGN